MSTLYKNIRLKHYDYHTGWFFITNKTNFGKDLLKDKIYDIAEQELYALVKKTNGVSLDYGVFMLNHIHAILIFDDAELNLSEFWRRYKAITTLKAKRAGLQEESLWQRNYFEHVIRTEKALFRIREYIKHNPYKENIPIREIYEP